jgi:hypothetical protein
MRRVLVLLPLLLAAPAFAAEPEVWERPGDWVVFSASSDEGVFETCFAQKVYPNGEAVTFFYNGQVTTLAFFLENWQLDSRERYPVAVQVDEGAPIAATALAGEDRKSVALELEVSPFIDAWAAGKTLTLDTGAGKLAFAIEGAAAAFNSLAMCAVKNLGTDRHAGD